VLSDPPNDEQDKRDDGEHNENGYQQAHTTSVPEQARMKHVRLTLCGRAWVASSCRQLRVLGLSLENEQPIERGHVEKPAHDLARGDQRDCSAALGRSLAKLKQHPSAEESMKVTAVRSKRASAALERRKSWTSSRVSSTRSRSSSPAGLATQGSQCIAMLSAPRLRGCPSCGGKRWRSRGRAISLVPGSPPKPAGGQPVWPVGALRSAVRGLTRSGILCGLEDHGGSAHRLGGCSQRPHRRSR